jgi:hypothetical protein
MKAAGSRRDSHAPILIRTESFTPRVTLRRLPPRRASRQDGAYRTPTADQGIFWRPSRPRPVPHFQQRGARRPRAPRAEVANVIDGLLALSPRQRHYLARARRRRHAAHDASRRSRRNQHDAQLREDGGGMDRRQEPPQGDVLVLRTHAESSSPRSADDRMTRKVPPNLPDLGLNAHVFVAYKVKAAVGQRAQRQLATSCKYKTNSRPQGDRIADPSVKETSIETPV